MTTVNKAAKAIKTAKPATPAKAAPKSATKLSKSGQKLAPLPKDSKIVVLDKKFTFGGEGTKRAAAWALVGKAKTVADYVASGGPRKYLARWISAGAIKVA